MKPQPNPVSSSTHKRLRDGRLGEMLRQHLPGRIMTDGSEQWSAATQLLLAQRNDDYSPWSSRPDHISTWAPDRFESDLERHGDAGFDHLDFGSLVREQHPLRHFD